MATQIIHPQHRLDPHELDHYLLRGWRPTGQSIYTSDYLRTDDDELHGCLQIRLPLKGFAPKRRHARLLRRNGRRFRLVSGPAEWPDDELREVNRRYMEKHPSKTRVDLEYNVVNEAGIQVLDTHIYRVYEGERLAAFSYYDLGEHAVYTKAGIYDPDYAAASLGVYTMLLEVAIARDRGCSHYYPGYISPTYPAFDYKLQLGPMEYRNIETGDWIALEDGPTDHPADPLAINRRRLLELGRAVAAAGIRASLREYPSFTGRFRPQREGEKPMLDAPLLLLIGRPLPLEGFLLATYDNEQRRYRLELARAANLYDMRVQPYSERGTPRFTTPVVVDRQLAATRQPADIIAQIREQLGRGLGH